VALLGYGGAGHDGGQLTDVIQVAHVDFEKHSIALISLPRDLWVELPSGHSDKVNAAYMSDTENASVLKQMIATTTGLTPSYFIGIDFVGFQRAIGETLGGITVDVPETLDDPWYPIKGEELNTCGMSAEEIASVSAQYSGFELEKQFECRYEHVHIDKGITEMNGGDALKYVRSRHGSSAGDFSRSQRQHAVFKAIKSKLLSLDALNDIPGFFSKASKNTNTDLDLEIVKYLAPALKAGAEFEIKTVIISTDNVLTTSKSSTGQFILVPKAGTTNWSEVQAYVQQQLN
jgi:polyisoprenyl-teichoic acid--peptidoglycan teichoic acid transferase